MEKKIVLVTDDVEVNRVILREILKDEYNILEAADYTYYGGGKFGHNEDNSTNGQASAGNYNTQGTDLET
jgi:CheY-like chemotaxis protein